MRHGETFEAVLGDLAEEYALRQQDTSTARAHTWYWGQLVRSMPALIWLDVRRQGALSTIATAVAAWIVASTIESLAMIAILGSDAGGGTLPHFLIGLGAIALSGYLAALVRPAAPGILAAIVFVVVIALMFVSTERVPVWFQFGFLLMGPLASMAGGTWRGKRSRS